jgi:hypothetical protein
MITDLTVTDITDMHANRICIAAVDGNGISIRPIYRDRSIFRNWCFHDGQVIHQFSNIRLNLLQNNPHPPHTEDWYIDPQIKQLNGEIPESGRKQFLESFLDQNIVSIFGTDIFIGGGGGFM